MKDDLKRRDKISDLMICLPVILPTINDDWIKQNIDQLLDDSIKHLKSFELKIIGSSLSCLDFEESFKNATDKQLNNFCDKYADQVKEKSKELIKSIFIKWEVWDLKLSTEWDIDGYDLALKDIIYEIADIYAITWAEDQELARNEEGLTYIFEMDENGIRFYAKKMDLEELEKYANICTIS